VWVVSVFAGALLVTALPPSRAWRPEHDAPSAGPWDALSSPGVRSMVLISLPAGIGVGICEVAIPACTDSIGSKELAGVLLAVWSAGSAAGGLIYGSRARRPALARARQELATL